MEAFTKNTENLPCINHKDENPFNNCLDNLEWCTHSYNTNYGSCIKRRSSKLYKHIYQYSLDNNFIREYESIVDAKNSNNIDASSITKCAMGKRKSAGGFIWKYQ